jgi:hypothetical protein
MIHGNARWIPLFGGRRATGPPFPCAGPPALMDLGAIGWVSGTSRRGGGETGAETMTLSSFKGTSWSNDLLEQWSAHVKEIVRSA